MAKYRVLSLDGGGIRGLLTTTLLQRLARQPGLEGAFDKVDFVAGTSSGALIALGMAHGLKQTTMLGTLEAIRQAFVDGQKLFSDYKPWYAGGRIFCAKYSGWGRAYQLLHGFGEARLGDLSRKVLVPTFDLEAPWRHAPPLRLPWRPRLPKSRDHIEGKSWKPKIFHNFEKNVGHPHAEDNPDLGELAWRVAYRATAAITYFPIADGYIDAGVYANNPAMCAYAQLFDDRYKSERQAGDEIVFLSVGAGENLHALKQVNDSWGLVQWVLKARWVNLTFDGTVGIADYQVRQFLGHNYHRIAPPSDVALDAWERTTDIERLVEQDTAREMIAKCATWMRTYWM